MSSIVHRSSWRSGGDDDGNDENRELFFMDAEYARRNAHSPPPPPPGGANGTLLIDHVEHARGGGGDDSNIRTHGRRSRAMAAASGNGKRRSARRRRRPVTAGHDAVRRETHALLASTAQTLTRLGVTNARGLLFDRVQQHGRAPAHSLSLREHPDTTLNAAGTRPLRPRTTTRLVSGVGGTAAGEGRGTYVRKRVSTNGSSSMTVSAAALAAQTHTHTDDMLYFNNDVEKDFQALLTLRKDVRAKRAERDNLKKAVGVLDDTLAHEEAELETTAHVRGFLSLYGSPHGDSEANPYAVPQQRRQQQQSQSQSLSQVTTSYLQSGSGNGGGNINVTPEQIERLRATQQTLRDKRDRWVTTLATLLQSLDVPAEQHQQWLASSMSEEHANATRRVKTEMDALVQRLDDAKRMHAELETTQARELDALRARKTTLTDQIRAHSSEIVKVKQATDEKRRQIVHLNEQMAALLEMTQRMDPEAAAQLAQDPRHITAIARPVAVGPGERAATSPVFKTAAVSPSTLTGGGGEGATDATDRHPHQHTQPRVLDADADDIYRQYRTTTSRTTGEHVDAPKGRAMYHHPHHIDDDEIVKARGVLSLDPWERP